MADSAARFSSSRAEWLGARAALAGRRSGRFVLGATATFIVVLLVLLFVPQLSGPVQPDAAARVVRVDTIPLMRALVEARSASAHADSGYAAILARADSDAAGDTVGVRATRDSVRAVAAGADSALALAHAANVLADRKDVEVRERANRRVPPVAMLAAAAVLAVIIGFSVSLLAEIGRPTVATSREAERAAQAPVLAVVRDGTTQAGELDPFHLLYLELTARGIRVGTITIGGDDRAISATVSGRLARAAAGDERATLVVDADAEASPVAGYYRERPEPGFSDVMAGVRSWREVARPVGASDGLAIDVVPGGSIRRESPDAGAVRAARKEFAAFRAEYDLCIIAAPSAVARERLLSAVERPVVIVCAEVGRTSLAQMRKNVKEWRDGGASVHGVMLWDGELPYVSPRNELMSKVLQAPLRVATPAAPMDTL